MLERILSDQFLRKLDSIEYGRLTLTTPSGVRYEFEGSEPGVHANMQLNRWSALSNIMIKGDVGLADGYYRGAWDTDNLNNLIQFGVSNSSKLEHFISGNRVVNALVGFSYKMRLNTLQGSKRNIQEHYDLGNEFYKLWLDSSMTYSSAIFDDKDAKQSLEHAQANKYQRIVERLDRPTGNILEVGCGWGGFIEHAVTRGDHHVKGITLSNEQHQYAQQRLSNFDSDVVLEDYRHQNGKYDSIVSIEMFEAVGEKFWPIYFSKLASLLNRSGKAVIQTITIDDSSFDTYRKSSDCIRSYIFPGGMLPSKQRFSEEASRAGLKITDRYDFGQDYARTLEVWLHNFDRVSDKLLTLGFDDAFMRIWRFYLGICIAGFKTGKTDVMQVELQHV